MFLLSPTVKHLLLDFPKKSRGGSYWEGSAFWMFAEIGGLFSTGSYFWGVTFSMSLSPPNRVASALPPSLPAPALPAFSAPQAPAAMPQFVDLRLIEEARGRGNGRMFTPSEQLRPRRPEELNMTLEEELHLKVEGVGPQLPPCFLSSAPQGVCWGRPWADSVAPEVQGRGWRMLGISKSIARSGGGCVVLISSKSCPPIVDDVQGLWFGIPRYRQRVNNDLADPFWHQMILSCSFIKPSLLCSEWPIVVAQSSDGVAGIVQQPPTVRLPVLPFSRQAGSRICANPCAGPTASAPHWPPPKPA